MMKKKIVVGLGAMAIIAAMLLNVNISSKSGNASINADITKLFKANNAQAESPGSWCWADDCKSAGKTCGPA